MGLADDAPDPGGVIAAVIADLAFDPGHARGVHVIGEGKAEGLAAKRKAAADGWRADPGRLLCRGRLLWTGLWRRRHRGWLAARQQRGVDEDHVVVVFHRLPVRVTVYGLAGNCRTSTAVPRARPVITAQFVSGQARALA